MAINDSSRFFIVRGSSDPAVLGNRTGIKQADIKKEGFRDPREYDRLIADLGTSRYWQIRDLVPNGHYEVQSVVLFGKSKLTDFLRFGPALIHAPFMISEKVHRIFSMHRLLSLTNFPARVIEQNGEGHEYSLIHLVPMPLSEIDFSQSVFWIGDPLKGEVKREFADEEEFVRETSSKRLRVDHLCVGPDFSEMDLFSLPTGQLVMSEKLKIALEEHDAASGVDLLPAFGTVGWPVICVSR